MAKAPGIDDWFTIDHIDYWKATKVCLCYAPRIASINGGAASISDAIVDERETAFRIWVRSRYGGAGGGAQRA